MLSTQTATPVRRRVESFFIEFLGAELMTKNKKAGYIQNTREALTEDEVFENYKANMKQEN